MNIARMRKSLVFQGRCSRVTRRQEEPTEVIVEVVASRSVGCTAPHLWTNFNNNFPENASRDNCTGDAPFHHSLLLV